VLLVLALLFLLFRYRPYFSCSWQQINSIFPRILVAIKYLIKGYALLCDMSISQYVPYVICILPISTREDLRNTARKPTFNPWSSYTCLEKFLKTSLKFLILYVMTKLWDSSHICYAKLSIRTKSGWHHHFVKSKKKNR
jgi:hypothetical protein